MFKSFMDLLKTKAAYITMLIMNIFIFGVGLYVNSLELMLIAGCSYATILLSMELNKNEDKE